LSTALATEMQCFAAQCRGSWSWSFPFLIP